MVSQLVRATVERGITQYLIAKNYSWTVRCSRHVLLKQAMQRLLRSIGGCGIIPSSQQRLFLRADQR